MHFSGPDPLNWKFVHPSDYDIMALCPSSMSSSTFFSKQARVRTQGLKKCGKSGLVLGLPTCLWGSISLLNRQWEPWQPSSFINVHFKVNGAHGQMDTPSPSNHTDNLSVKSSSKNAHALKNDASPSYFFLLRGMNHSHPLPRRQNSVENASTRQLKPGGEVQPIWVSTSPRYNHSWTSSTSRISDWSTHRKGKKRGRRPATEAASDLQRNNEGVHENSERSTTSLTINTSYSILNRRPLF